LEVVVVAAAAIRLHPQLVYRAAAVVAERPGLMLGILPPILVLPSLIV
jgi:hypothetical protein